MNKIKILKIEEINIHGGGNRIINYLIQKFISGVR